MMDMDDDAMDVDLTLEEMMALQDYERQAQRSGPSSTAMSTAGRNPADFIYPSRRAMIPSAPATSSRTNAPLSSATAPTNNWPARDPPRRPLGWDATSALDMSLQDMITAGRKARSVSNPIATSRATTARHRTTSQGGPVVLPLLRDAANHAPSPRHRQSSSRITIGPFPSDVSVAAVRDLLQSEVGPIDAIRMDKGVADVVFWDAVGWKAFDRFNGEYIDNKWCLQVYPLVSLVPTGPPKTMAERFEMDGPYTKKGRRII